MYFSKRCLSTRFLVVDALARAGGSRYSTFDVVGSGPRVVAGIVHGRGYSVDLKAYELVFNEASKLRRYDAVFISIMSSDKGALEKLLALLERRRYSGLVVVGGPASIEYSLLLRRYSRIDYVVVGEAEIPLERFLDNIDYVIEKDYSKLKNTPSIAYRDGDKVVLTSPHIHTPVEKLSSMKPWTNIQLSYPNHKVHRYYVEVVRGCSNYQRPRIKGFRGLNCTECLLCKSRDLEKRLICPANIPAGCGFCSVPYLFGPPRTRSVESIVEEIDELVRNGARRIVLSAPDFLDYGREWLVKPKPLTNPCSPEPNVEAIDQLLGEIYSLRSIRGYKVYVMVENIKACLVNEEVVKTMAKRLHGTSVHIGLETGDPVFNEKYLGKPITPRHVYRAVKLFKKYGMRPYIYLIYGLPFMDRSVYSKTINAVKKLSKLGVEKITLYRYIRLPGTAFENIEYSISGREDLVAKLKKLVDNVNLENKKVFLDKELEVFLVYSSGKYYGYPARHGPVVYVKGLVNPRFSGCRAVVRIYDIGVRNLWGRFMKIIEC